MNKISILLFVCFFIAKTGFAQSVKQTNSYQFFINLNSVQDDKLTVDVVTPRIKKAIIQYQFPAIVPGTYAIYNFGRYVSGFKAFKKNGDTLKVIKTGVNNWQITNAKALYKISYKIDDTWDSPEIKGETIFEPGGSNIEAEKAFMLNTFTFAGYFDGLINSPYELNFTKPLNFYGSTSLVASKTTDSTEFYKVDNYRDLADAPMMFSIPDTSHIEVGGADILISIYSPNKKVKSATVARDIKSMMEAQKEYLGGKLPIKKYAFLIAMATQLNSGAFGALEHSYSSFYFLPETMGDAQLAKTIKDVSAHEFFHILTPLNIHSKEIGDFDFANPIMSKHLWLYEGMTEYAAQHMQVIYGLVDLPTFLKVISTKITNSQQFNDTLPFTVMSKGALDVHKKQYQNVYEKGALINLCLDIQLRKLSNGKSGTQTLMKSLAEKYGKEKSFQDDELFDVITGLTFPPIRNFFADYVEGIKPLPFKEMFNLIGVDYIDVQKDTTFSFFEANTSSRGLTLGTENRIMFAPSFKPSAFAKKLGLLPGDEIVSIGGIKLTTENFRDEFQKINMNAKIGNEFSMVVLRKGAGGVKSELSLKESVIFEPTFKKNLLIQQLNASKEQLALRAAWLSKNN